jgi:hypothetical protein
MEVQGVIPFPAKRFVTNATTPVWLTSRPKLAEKGTLACSSFRGQSV